MTKKEIIQALEKSKKIIDFDFNYLMRQPKARLEHFYEICCRK